MKVVFTKKLVEDKLYKNYYIDLENGTMLPIQIKKFNDKQVSRDLKILEVISSEYESK